MTDWVFGKALKRRAVERREDAIMQRVTLPFQLTVNDDAQGAFVKATGRFVLGRSTDQRLWAPAMTLAAGKVLTLDLCGIVQLDAAGIGMLVGLKQDARKHGGDASSGLPPVRVSAGSSR